MTADLRVGIHQVNVVEKLSDTELKVKVVRGGKLKARKGVNVPDVEIDCAALTAKDIEEPEVRHRLVGLSRCPLSF